MGRHYNIVHFQQGVPYHVSETRFCKYYPERVKYMLGCQSIEAIQLLAYIGRTRKNIVHTGNGREVHLAGVHNAKVDGYCTQTNKVFL